MTQNLHIPGVPFKSLLYLLLVIHEFYSFELDMVSASEICLRCIHYHKFEVVWVHLCATGHHKLQFVNPLVYGTPYISLVFPLQGLTTCIRVWLRRYGDCLSLELFNLNTSLFAQQKTFLKYQDHFVVPEQNRCGFQPVCGYELVSDQWSWNQILGISRSSIQFLTEWSFWQFGVIYSVPKTKINSFRVGSDYRLYNSL